MLKKEIITLLTSKIKPVDVEIVKVYGVPMGVGYDLNILLSNNQKIKAHATNKNWALVGHLQENQIEFYKYTGKNDRYRGNVINYWLYHNALSRYLSRFKKVELLEMLKNNHIL